MGEVAVELLESFEMRNGGLRVQRVEGQSQDLAGPLIPASERRVTLPVRTYGYVRILVACRGIHEQWIEVVIPRTSYQNLGVSVFERETDYCTLEAAKGRTSASTSSFRFD